MGSVPLKTSNSDGYKPERVPAALKLMKGQFKEGNTKLEDMKPVIVEHGEMKLIGIPCISLNDMSGKYHHAKEGLLSSTKYFPAVRNHSVHYGIWPVTPSQSESDQHAYILCVEVDSLDDIPEWYFKSTLPPQRCVVVPNESGNYDAACQVVDQYVADNGLVVDASGRKYTICERYNYEGEGFAKYSLPILVLPEGEQ
ncbi:effector binding domain-containing protein [Paenibacillus sp. CF384]|uniref:effector binding domain-containing protein n=1 Tax=Paenibacillus sp. CF384 TaxID=1884382 RepID=UPI0008968F3D|nr:effector binding domain-containing protein [Paenibacillus sp. CF384]SDW21036.1 Integron-associated effector binding protein [Paenibacillus sp. CF384]